MKAVKFTMVLVAICVIWIICCDGFELSSGEDNNEQYAECDFSNCNLVAGEATFGSAKWTIPFSVQNSDHEELYSYNLVVKVISDGKVCVVGMKLNSNNVAVLVPNDMVLGGDNYDVIQIGDEATISITGRIKSLVLEENTTIERISGYAFNGVSRLENVSFGEGLKHIDHFAFKDTGIHSLVFPSTLESIDAAAFHGCSSLTEIDVTSSEHYSLSHIDYTAFARCSALTSVTLPFSNDFITKMSGVPVNIFKDCPNLTTVESANGIGKNIVDNTGAIPGVRANWIYEAREDGSLTLITATSVPASYIVEDEVSVIAPYSFINAKQLRELTISDSVVSIWSYAFREIGIESIIFGDSVKYIGPEAFYGNDLTSVVFPDSLKSLSESSFAYNSELTEVVFEGGNVNVEKSFIGCPIGSLKCLDQNGRVSSEWGIITGSNIIADLSISGPFVLSDKSFNNNAALKKVTLSGNIVDINPRAFTGCNNIECFEYIGNSERYSSEDGTIIDSGNLILVPPKCSIIDLSTPVRSIFEGAFSGNTNLIQLVLSEESTISEIPTNCFKGCSSLVSVSLPSSIESIGAEAFSGCSSLSEIIISEENNLKNLGNNAFAGTGIMSIVLADIESIGQGCFKDCKNLVSVEITGGSVSSLPAKTFSGSSLRSVSVPSSVSTIDATSFENCPNLSNVIFEEGSPFYFDGYAVYEGHKLVLLIPSVISFSMPSDVSEIGQGAFDNANDLQEITTADNLVYSTYEGILYNHDMSSIVYVPLGIRQVTIAPSITTINPTIYPSGSPFQGRNEISTFVWISDTITATDSRINAKKVILVASNSIVLGDFSLWYDNKTLIFDAPSIEMQGYVSPSHLSVVYITADSITIRNNAIYADCVCIGCNSQDEANSMVEQLPSDPNMAIYVGSADLSILDPRFAGIFDYDADTYSIEMPVDYMSGVSIFYDSHLDSVNISGISVDSGILEFSLAGDGVDYMVSVNGVIVECDASTQKYLYTLPENAVVVRITVEQLHSEITCNVHFNLYGGTGTESVEIFYGGTLRSYGMPDPMKSGYTFTGWYLDAQCTVPYDNNSKIYSDLELYAGWEYNNGNYLVKILSHESGTIIAVGTEKYSSGELIQSGCTTNISYANTVNWECTGWIVNGETRNETELSLLIDKDYYIEPILRYSSPSNDLMDLVEIKSPRYGEDLYLQYELKYGGINGGMGVWSGFPSTPAVMDNAVFVRAGTVLYKYDADTGEILKTADSKLMVAYYLYLGVGGGKVYDYATGLVYDSDLNQLYESPLPFRAVFYDSGYFYGIYQTKVYKMDASTGSLDNTDGWREGVNCNWFGIYGTTSIPVFDSGFMYYIEAGENDNYRGIAAINLSTGSKSTINLGCISGRLLDDGWLSCYHQGDRAILYLPSYTKGLFDPVAGQEKASLTAVVVNVDGTLDNDCTVVEIYLDQYSYCAAYLTFQGRGYIQSEGTLYVVDADKMAAMIAISPPGLTTITAETFENEYVIYKEQSVGTHGSIVISTGYYSETGRVYVYVLPYGPPSSVYIFEDYEGKTEPTGYFKSSAIGTNYCSQAVRVTLKGNLLWYTDSGIVYCCGTMDNNPYVFSIDSDGLNMEIEGYGVTALDALRDALRRNNVPSDIAASGRVLSLANQTGDWRVDAYYGGKWNNIVSLSNSSNNIHHLYRITLNSEPSVKEEVEFTVSPNSLNLMLDSDSVTGSIQIIGDIPSDSTLTWVPVNEGVISIAVSDDTLSATVTGLAVGSTVINVLLDGESVYGETQFAITVIENPNPPERSYTFTIRMEYDADKIDAGESGYSPADLRLGIALSATGLNAGEALEKALNEARIPNDFFSNDTLFHWVNHIFGMEQVHYSNGDWKYWIQYQIVNGELSYNDFTLGYYTKGGEFALVYSVTDEDNHMVGPGDVTPDIPEESDNPGSKTTVEVKENEDGSTTVIVDSVSADGKVHTVAVSSDSEIVTIVKADGEDGSYNVSDESIHTALQQQSAASDAAGTGKDKVIEISSDTSDVSVSVGKQAFESMADDGVSFRVVSAQGSMTFGRDAVAGLSGKDDVTLSFAIADRSSMTSAQREVIEAGSTVVSLTATSAGQSIGSNLGGKVVVTVKHATADGKTPVAYYVDGDGNRTKVAEQHYDAEKEEMTMVLDHFSIYTIVDESPAGEEIPVAVLVMTAVIVLICLGILLPQVVGRKQ